MKKVKSVSEYIDTAPEEMQGALKQLRKIILETVPGAEEKLSYSMPYYGYHGRLAYFAYAKNHIGLYIPPPVIKDHATELKKYKTAMATVQFPHNEKLPAHLIKKLIKARVQKIKESKKF